MASSRYMPSAALLMTICLDLSSAAAAAAAAAVVWNPKTSRYDSYNLEKGPVFYEAYYPDAGDAYQEKRYFDRSTVLETSFQVPADRFAYSAESANRAVPRDDAAFIVVENGERPAEGPRGGADRRSVLVEDRGEGSPAASIGEISKLVRRAISQDLENWNVLERYLDRADDQRAPPPPPPPPRSEMRSGVDRNNKEPRTRVSGLRFESSEEPSPELRPAYLEEIRNDAPIRAPPGSLPLENIFQPRPQIIKYTFLKKTAARLDEPSDGTIDSTTPRNYGDNLIREEIGNGGRDGKLAKGNVKVTSIRVSELPPRRKTRHHHGELPKRDYTARRHRSATTYPSPVVQ